MLKTYDGGSKEKELLGMYCTVQYVCTFNTLLDTLLDSTGTYIKDDGRNRKEPFLRCVLK